MNLCLEKTKCPAILSISAQNLVVFCWSATVLVLAPSRVINLGKEANNLSTFV
jgi:hypothetical protein